jgi:putative DNA primase/helicase
MTSPPSPPDPAAERIAAIVGRALADAADGARDDSRGDGADDAPPAPDDGEEDRLPSDSHDPDIDIDVVRSCAGLDHSDTDNSLRLRKHFGADLMVVARQGVAGGDWAGWTGAFWDIGNGAALSIMTCQKLGARIGLEAGFLNLSESEEAEVAKARPLRNTPAKQRSASDNEIVARADALIKGLAARRSARRKFGVHAKNAGRIDATLKMASPHLRIEPDNLNAAPLRFACRSHTIDFVQEPDPECPDPDANRMRWTCRATPGHDRAHLITGVVAADYDPAAQAPQWMTFLNDRLPDADKRRTVQVFSGLGLTGLLIQRLMFHYGTGANGKSVFLETLFSLYGPSMGVALPAESITGAGDRKAGGPSPDIVRLFGKRALRVSELPAGARVDMELVKRLTGGEGLAVRSLYEGYFEFVPKAKAHWSGNDKPGLDGGDYATFRRLLLVHWDTTVDEAVRRDIHDMVSDFMTEGAGILNWLIAGVLDYLNAGHKIFVAQAISDDTEEYRSENDPVGEFVKDCLEFEEGARAEAEVLFAAYKSYCAVTGRNEPLSQLKFGRALKKRVPKKGKINGRVFYHGVRIGHVPQPATTGPQPDEVRNGGF